MRHLKTLPFLLAVAGVPLATSASEFTLPVREAPAAR